MGGLIFFFISLILNLREKQRNSIYFLLISALLFFSFAALLDPFLNIYDERFHALVAKNLTLHPFKPTLYDDPIVNMPYDRWDKFHIWLHKQPLFLWQIALSFELFGLSEFALRIPSILLMTILVLAGYRIGKLLINERIGIITGILIISSLYNIQLVAGRRMLDHNDVSFLVYISLSIWSLVEYRFSGRKVWIYLIGLFAGLAILCKWIVGLLVYFGWFIIKIQEKKFNFKDSLDLLQSVFVTVLIALPWQIYIYIKYPVEASMANLYNAQHFYKVIEGHRGTFWFHLDQFNFLFGHLAAFLIIPSYYFLFKRIRDKKIFFAMLGMLCITYLFFSIAKTKMYGFPIIVSLLVYIPIAVFLDFLIENIMKLQLNIQIKKGLTISFLMLVFIIRMDPIRIKEEHTMCNKDNSYTRMLVHNKEIFESLHLPENAVIF